MASQLQYKTPEGVIIPVFDIVKHGVGVEKNEISLRYMHETSSGCFYLLNIFHLNKTKYKLKMRGFQWGIFGVKNTIFEIKC